MIAVIVVIGGGSVDCVVLYLSEVCKLHRLGSEQVSYPVSHGMQHHPLVPLARLRPDLVALWTQAFQQAAGLHDGTLLLPLLGW